MHVCTDIYGVCTIMTYIIICMCVSVNLSKRLKIFDLRGTSLLCLFIMIVIATAKNAIYIIIYNIVHFIFMHTKLCYLVCTCIISFS